MKINYPFGINKIKNNDNKKQLSYINKNKGMYLENFLNITNKFYKENDIALIYKKPTPIQIVSMDKSKNHITNAYFLEKSTTDYNGIYKGKYIDFEAKECSSSTSFPLKNIKTFQLDHLKKVKEMGGVAFIIFYFKKLDTYFLLFIEQILDFFDNSKRNSIPYEYFQKSGHQIKFSLNPPLDYLKIIAKELKIDST